VSVDGGRSWSSWHNQPTAQLYHVSTDERFPYWVYGPQQDAGAVGLPSRTTTNDGITMEQFKEVTVGGESQNIAPDPLDPQIVYGGTVDKLDTRTEQTRSIDPTAPHPDQWRTTWTLPLAFSHRDPRVLYFSRQKIFRTDDGGEHWTVISPDLTREKPAVPATLDSSSARHDLGLGPRRGVVYSLAPSYLADHELWAGTDDGLVWRTRDDGEHWANVTPSALTPWSKVGIIEPSHFDAQTCYLAVDRHRLDDRRPYIYRTRDGGRSWQLVVAGIAAGHFVNAVREDPARRGLLYAATEEGVTVSFDDGDHWQPLQLNLPATSVRDFAVYKNDLIVATHGRGFWVIDDISPLRQITDAVIAADAVLFKPSDAVNVVQGDENGTPLQQDEPQAENPPAGAVIDYYLKAAATGPVTLEILDASGASLHLFSTEVTAEPAPTRRGIPNVSPLWRLAPEPFSGAAGMHRVVWLPVAPAPRGQAGGGGGGFGRRATPLTGTFTAKLTVNGQSYTQTFSVKADPTAE
jgi:hypothetical protein